MQDLLHKEEIQQSKSGAKLGKDEDISRKKIQIREHVTTKGCDEVGSEERGLGVRK